MRYIVTGIFVAFASVSLLGCGGTTDEKTQAARSGSGATSERTRSASSSGGAADRLTGGGSSFVAPIMKVWAREYGKARGLQVDYTSSGSGDGIAKMIERQNDFGCTDAYLNTEQLGKARSKGGEVLHIPLIMGGVVPVYNLPGMGQQLKFTGPVLADIYLGKIKKWNDAALAKLNAGVMLPDVEIVPVHRADGSGTTFIFTDYLCKVSPEFAKGPGQGMEVKWPEGGIGAPKSDGMAGQVTRTKGAIGYVELLYALRNKTKYGLVQNKEGEFIEASLESVTAAAEEALTEIPDDLRFSITDAKGKKSYPISGTTWAVLYVKHPPEKAKALADFFQWVTRADGGQSFTKELQYANLPKGLVERVDKKLEQLRAGVQ